MVADTHVSKGKGRTRKAEILRQQRKPGRNKHFVEGWKVPKVEYHSFYVYDAKGAESYIY